MPFSSGVFSLVAGNPVTTGTTISSTWANDTLDDIADNGLSICLLKDGTQTPTANIPLGGFKLTGLGNGTAVADAPRVSQVQNQAFSMLTSVAGTNTITGVATPTPAAYAEGQVFRMLPLNTNTGQATLNVSSLGAVPIFFDTATTATASAIMAGVPIEFMYISTTSSTGMHIIGSGGFNPIVRKGTWTPSIGGNATYTTQAGRWTKIGRLVFYELSLTINSLGTGSVTTVSGIPFTCNNSGLPGTGSMNSWNALASSIISINMQVGANTTNINFFGTSVATANVSQLSIFGNGASIFGSGFYSV